MLDVFFLGMVTRKRVENKRRGSAADGLGGGVSWMLGTTGLSRSLTRICSLWPAYFVSAEKRPARVEVNDGAVRTSGVGVAQSPRLRRFGPDVHSFSRLLYTSVYCRT